MGQGSLVNVTSSDPASDVSRLTILLASPLFRKIALHRPLSKEKQASAVYLPPKPFRHSSFSLFTYYFLRRWILATHLCGYDREVKDQPEKNKKRSWIPDNEFRV